MTTSKQPSTITEAIANKEWTINNRAEFLLVFATQMSKKITGGEAWIARKGKMAVVRWKTSQGFVEPYAPFAPKDTVEALLRGGHGLSGVMTEGDDLRWKIANQ